MCETWRCYRLCELMVKRMELDDAMNWLSTLGGAYSALGDYFVHHVCSLWPFFILFLLTSMTLSSCVYYWKVELKMINTNHQRRWHLHHFTKFQWSKQSTTVCWSWAPSAAIELIRSWFSQIHRLQGLALQQHIKFQHIRQCTAALSMTINFFPPVFHWGNL